MAKFNFIKTPILGLLVIKPTIFGDDRGFFAETYNKKEFMDYDIRVEFVQDSYSRSSKGVLRGLHFQNKFPQGKLIRIMYGAVFDVAVDLRRGSSTYRQFFGLILSEKNRKMFYIPAGFAHGFLTLSDYAEIFYKFTDYYYSEYDSGFVWNDPDLNINWPLEEYNIKEVTVSTKDQNLPMLKDIESHFKF